MAGGEKFREADRPRERGPSDEIDVATFDAGLRIDQYLTAGPERAATLSGAEEFDEELEVGELLAAGRGGAPVLQRRLRILAARRRMASNDEPAAP